MKRGTIWLLALLFLTAVVTAADAGDYEVRAIDRNPNPGQPAYVPGKVIVKFAPTMIAADRATLQTQYGLAVAYQSTKPGWFTVYDCTDPAATVAALKSEPGVIYAERALYRFTEGNVSIQQVPQDFFYGWQWNMEKIGMEQAWDLSTGEGVTVAVLDTGLNAAHSDFMTTSLAPGFDFADMDPDTTPVNMHGTHVSGTIAQSTWNAGYGCAGIAYKATVMPVKIFADGGGGAPDYVTANGIMFAADNGAKVINLSMGGYGYSNTLHDAVKYADAAGVLVVASAGNDNVPWDHYPSGYPEVMSVAATTIEDTKASYSNYGKVEIAAPGGDMWPGYPVYGPDPIPFIFQATSGCCTFSWYSGTSMAAPHVSGVAALVWAKNPGLSPAEVKSILTGSATAIGDDYYFGAGRVDAYAALMATPDTGTPAGWRKALGGKGWEEAFAVAPTADGGYVVAGSSWSYTHGHAIYDEDFLIYKLDAAGNKLWRKNYGGFDPDNATAVFQTADGGYVVAGTSESYRHSPGTWSGSSWDTDLLVYKLNADGSKAWRKNYGGEFPDGVMWGGMMLTDARPTPDGGIILCSSTLTYTYGGSPWADMNILVYKLDADGNKQWRKVYGGAGDDLGVRITTTSDGGYALVGMTDSYTHGDEDGIIYKLDAAGGKQWRKNYGGSEEDMLVSIQQTADGGYIACGGTQSYHSGVDDNDMLVYKLDANGDKQWRRNYGGSDDDMGIDIKQTSDGGYLMCGNTESYLNDNPWDWDSGIVYKLAPDGSKEWRKLYGGPAGGEYLYSLQLTSDGGFVMAGGSLSYGSGTAEYFHYHDFYEYMYMWFYYYGFWGYYQYPHWYYGGYYGYPYYTFGTFWHWLAGDFVVYKLDANGEWQ